MGDGGREALMEGGKKRGEGVMMGWRKTEGGWEEGSAFLGGFCGHTFPNRAEHLSGP